MFLPGHVIEIRFQPQQLALDPRHLEHAEGEVWGRRSITAEISAVRRTRRSIYSRRVIIVRLSEDNIVLRSPVSQDRRRPTTEEARMHDTATVLIIDDEPVVLQVLRIILTRSGHKVLSAGNGQEALDLCAQAGYHIDLAIVDVMMPGLRGPDVLAQLRERIPGLPAMLVSGFAGGQDFVGTGDRFIGKPFKAADVLEAVNERLSADIGFVMVAG